MLKSIFKSNDANQVSEETRLQDEERRKRLKKFLRKATIDEIRNPGMYKTLMRVRDITEDGVKIVDSLDVEKWLNRLVFNRSQIIDVYCVKEKNSIKEYVVTYWEVVQPKDWEIRTQNTVH
ncbi:hypothetical protein [uncultured Clostridium sp.]|jgi:hypothetical protein|uniref:hypothetical protein n=1 Tax=uncultured Clostridium sp. TaxID=59620 RepID=UPI0026099B68|nr:hypothetical protein [uncultured Clostridium sp.]